jgi:predicted small lipoprotein YifL
MKKSTWVLLVCASVVAAGCGQKGPLFLPDKNASVVTRPGNTTTSTPPPAPESGTTAPPTSTQPQPTQPQDKNKDDDQSTTPKN